MQVTLILDHSVSFSVIQSRSYLKRQTGELNEKKKCLLALILLLIIDDLGGGFFYIFWPGFWTGHDT